MIEIKPLILPDFKQSLKHKVEHIKQLEQTVENHPMTARFYKTPTHYIVHLPNGAHGMIDLVRVEKANNKTKALVRLLMKLENLWEESKL